MTSHCRNIKEHQNTYPLHSLLTFSRLTAFFFLPYLYCCIPPGLVKLKHHSRCMTGYGSHVQRRRVCLRGNDEFLLLLPNTKCEANSPWTSDTSLHSGAERILAAGMNPSILAQMSPLLPTSLQTWRLANPTKKKHNMWLFQRLNAGWIPTLPGGPRLLVKTFKKPESSNKNIQICSPSSRRRKHGAKPWWKCFISFSSQQMLNEQHGSLDLHL